MKTHASAPPRSSRSATSLRSARSTLALLLGAWAIATLTLACGGDTADSPGSGGQGSGANGQGNGSNGSGNNGQGGNGSIDGDPNADPLPPVSKVDLLLMIDNSASMADKQAVLSRALPDLVARLTAPDCVRADASGSVVERLPSSSGACPSGLAPEIAPVTDIHIGVITSSLGGHGSDQCNGSAPGRNNDDRARLITRSLAGGAAPTWAGNAGFLQWDPQGKHSPPGESDPNALVAAASALVAGAGETGCGFESSLEATYRFLIDPAPPKQIAALDPASPNLATAEITGIDDELLQQRAEFLRPDSFVAVVVLSDENDCSTVDGLLPTSLQRNGQPAAGWNLERNGGFPINYVANIGSAAGKEHRMRSGTSACATDPDSAACKSCFLEPEGPGCRDLPREEDNLSLRCWDQKRRFGVDLMYPVQRYIDGFQERQIFDLRPVNDGGQAALVENPLFQDLPRLRYDALKRALAEGAIPQAEFDTKTARLGADIATRPAFPPRSRRAIAFTAIVGVPWQDLANDPRDLSAGYKRTEALSWANIRSEGGAPPADPFMRESNVARSGTHPITGEVLALGTPNGINGHEWNSEAQDLMFACTLPLPTPRDCEDAAGNCDCTYLSKDSSSGEVQQAADAAQNPLCQATPGAPYGQKQYAAKAYPGGRFVEVAHGLQGRSVLASVCAPNITEPSRADFGYRPAVAALVDRMRTR